MKKAKPVLIIIGTLAIGFVLGMLTSAQLRFHKLKPVRMFFSEARFREGFYQMIQPDDKQKETIDQLLSKYAKLNITAMNDFSKKLDSLMNEFWQELEPSLTKEQLNRLKEMERRRDEMIRSVRRNIPDSLRLREGERHRPGDPGPGGAGMPGGPPRYNRMPPRSQPDTTASN